MSCLKPSGSNLKETKPVKFWDPLHQVSRLRHRVPVLVIAAMGLLIQVKLGPKLPMVQVCAWFLDRFAPKSRHRGCAVPGSVNLVFDVFVRQAVG